MIPKPHFTKRGGMWWKFRSRQVYEQFLSELKAGKPYPQHLAPQRLVRPLSVIDATRPL